MFTRGVYKEDLILSSHTPRKRFGQNFLQDKNVIEKIITSINPSSHESMVEIGPGQGALTGYLLSYLKHLDVIELDRDLIPGLRALSQDENQLTIYQADVLQFDFHRLFDGENKLYVVGNLPYNISTPLLFHLFSQIDVIQEMYFMLQKEVAERLCANVGTKAYGRLGIMAQYYCKMEMLFDVPPEAFYPAPQVTSSFIQLTPYQKLPHDECDTEILSTIVAKAFNQRRKTIRNAFKDMITVDQLNSLGIDPGLRPEQLTLAQYIALTNSDER